jgi:hypothetical protein
MQSSTNHLEIENLVHTLRQTNPELMQVFYFFEYIFNIILNVGPGSISFTFLIYKFLCA